MTISNLVDRLEQDKPSLHRFDGQSYNWQLVPDALRWIQDNVSASSYSLETGCGYSSIIFAACQSNHIVISPSAEEHSNIKIWCDDHGFSTEKVQFIKDYSQFALPNLKIADSNLLDVVLIDGAHAFPFPYIDWFYTDKILKKNGFMVIDDTHLRSIYLLEEFLESEKGRWRKVKKTGTTAIFQKLCVSSFAEGDWESQTFSRKLETPVSLSKRFKNKIARLKNVFTNSPS
jgi:hypothetical protein